MINFLRIISNKISIVSVIVIVFFVSGIIIGSILNKKVSVINVSDNCSPDLEFIRVEQDCESFEGKISKIQNIQDLLKRQTSGYISSNRAHRVSVFVRDLDRQRFAIVNEAEEFFMASLLKVPLAIAYYRLAELTPDLLSQKITYDGKTDLYALQIIQPPEKLVVGSTYTVRELLNRMLTYSDNTATELLSQNFVSYDYLQKILFTLGIQSNTSDQRENLVSARSYAGILRTLYNSSFLSRSYSNEILTALSKSTFVDGAVKNIPEDVSIAHKFGERSVVDTSGQIITRQLHDCGIVYAKNGKEPYSFCIMTEGSDMENLKSIIQNISETIYKEIVE